MISSKIGSCRVAPRAKTGACPQSGRAWRPADQTRPQIRSTRRVVVTRTRSTGSRWLLVLALPLFDPAGILLAGDPDRPDSRITRYDIATRDDLLLAHLVA